MRQLAVEGVEGAAQFVLVVDDVVYLLEILLVGTVGYPQFDVALTGILFEDMGMKARPLFLFSHLRIVLQAKFHGTPEHLLGFKVAVGFGHELAVDAAGLPAARCAVVFHGLLHHVELFGGKPLA